MPSRVTYDDTGVKKCQFSIVLHCSVGHWTEKGKKLCNPFFMDLPTDEGRYAPDRDSCMAHLSVILHQEQNGTAEKPWALCTSVPKHWKQLKQEKSHSKIISACNRDTYRAIETLRGPTKIFFGRGQSSSVLSDDMLNRWRYLWKVDNVVKLIWYGHQT